ncbi:Gfo/Idh/MocA family protein [Micromonospora sp. NPDC051141]|uniref:Gfo/Idh/MocA family protein n=1 Tax=Micromonospora sp. NPDC051141 TaxID=3364284 RepID=UPI00379099C8
MNTPRRPTELSWGVIGTSRIATEYVIPAIRAAGGSVAAIGSRDGDRGREVADKLDIPAAYGSYEELLADDRLEAIYVALPNALHTDWVRAALVAGRHTLCEKPLTRSRRDAETLTELAERDGLVLMEGYMFRHHPQWATLSAVLDAGDAPVVVRSHIGYRMTADADIRLHGELGGGAFLDVGCYTVAAATELLGEATTATAQVVARHPETGVDTLTVAYLTFRDDRLAVLDSDFLLDWTTTPLEIRTPSRTVRLEHPYNPGAEPTEILVDRQGAAREHHRVASADAYRAMAGTFMRLVGEGATAPEAERERARIRSVAHNINLVWDALGGAER